MAKKSRSTKKQLRTLRRQLADLRREHRRLAKRVRRLARQRLAFPSAPVPGPFGGPPPGFGFRRGPGRPDGPTASLEVPLETDDPTAPLWATVSARLPEELTIVTDDGRVVRYRYSPVGSTPQAPRYRPVRETPPSAWG